MKNNEIFADTSGWVNFFIKTEPFYEPSKRLMQEWYLNQTRLVTTNYILIELVALLTSPLHVPRPQQIKTIDTIRTTPWVEIVYINASLEARAWDLLKAREDKTWSLVDCASFIVMQQRNITTAFTTDHHFEQAGFLKIP